MISKIEKAMRYAQEPDRINFNQFKVNFTGDHDSHTVTYSDGKWTCAEVSTVERLRFGTYEFQTISRLDQFDPNVVLGLFNYPPSDVGPDTTHEIDIEFAHWGRADAPLGNFTVWPVKNELKQSSHTFDVRLRDAHATRRFDWRHDRVEFASVHSHTGDTAQAISRWLFDRQPVASYISAAAMPSHVNLWLFQGRAPTDGQEVSVGDPANPTVLGTYLPPESLEVLRVAVDSGRVFAMVGAYLRHIDVSNPAAPFQTNSVLLGTYPAGVAITGDELYTVYSNYSSSYLDLFSLSNPISPTLLSSLYLSGWPVGLAVQADQVYVANDQYGLAVVDVSQPLTPTLVSSPTVRLTRSPIIPVIQGPGPVPSRFATNARKAFHKKAPKHRADLEPWFNRLMELTKRRWREWQEREPSLRPHPATFLNAEEF